MMNKNVYYHFLSSNYGIENLEKKRIKVSNLNSLNDPFEMVPYMRYKGLENRKPYHKIRNQLSKKYGLLCFSQSWQEPLLWSHYADKHKGLAIGFEILKDEILKVKYTDDPIRKQIMLTKDPIENERLFLDLAKIKYEKWEYESEYRIKVKLEECISSDCEYFLPFNNRLRVKEIVLGCKFNHKQESVKIKKLASAFSAEIIPTRIGWGDYKINKCGYRAREYEKLFL